MKKLKLEEILTIKSPIEIVQNTLAITGGNGDLAQNDFGGIFDPVIVIIGGG